MEGKRVIELGAGCALSGIAAAVAGANIVITDQVRCYLRHPTLYLSFDIVLGSFAGFNPRKRGKESFAC
jgi:hypothetical protein